MNALKTLRLSMAGLLAAAGISVAPAQSVTLSVLHQFTAATTDGAIPYSEVILGADGGLYGTSWAGGSKAAGVVFRMNPDGTGFTLLHQFGNAGDGSKPFDGVIQSADGFLYGTTYYGGTNSNGTIFKVSTNGLLYSVLYQFTNSPDGANPYGGVIQGQDGALYGTTQIGGSGPGTIFKIDTNGNNYTVLHSFTNFTDATAPYGRLAQASNGMLYGTTYSGGGSSIGAIFQINTNGLNYALVHSFDGSSDGFSPECGLLVGQDGWLYGTTVSGGNSSIGYGTVFKVSTNGNGFAVLHTFTNAPDGGGAYGRVTQGGDGYLYGTTANGGGTNAGGIIFRVNTNGANYSVLHQFNGKGDGKQPFAGLFTTGNGVFYGTTEASGASPSGFGTVYRLALVPTLTLDTSYPSAPGLTFAGLANQSCQVQVSSNLINWSFLTSVTLTNGSAQISDVTATNSPVRFYRAVIQ